MSEYYASSESVEWYTPRYIIDGVVQVLGGIDCDPCSNPPPYNVPATVHYTQADDGLGQPWRSRVFCNPPYGRGVIDRWVAKMRSEYLTGHTTALIALVPDSTDTKWFQLLWSADALCFHRGRVAFVGPDGLPVKGNTAGSVLPYWGPDPAQFARVFGLIGQVIYPNAPYHPPVQLALCEVPA